MIVRWNLSVCVRWWWGWWSFCRHRKRRSPLWRGTIRRGRWSAWSRRRRMWCRSVFQDRWWRQPVGRHDGGIPASVRRHSSSLHGVRRSEWLRRLRCNCSTRVRCMSLSCLLPDVLRDVSTGVGCRPRLWGQRRCSRRSAYGRQLSMPAVWMIPTSARPGVSIRFRLWLSCGAKACIRHAVLWGRIRSRGCPVCL